LVQVGLFAGDLADRLGDHQHSQFEVQTLQLSQELLQSLLDDQNHHVPKQVLGFVLWPRRRGVDELLVLEEQFVEEVLGGLVFLHEAPNGFETVDAGYLDAQHQRVQLGLGCLVEQ